MTEITLTKENFESEVIKSDKPILVDFWANWCGPCRMLAPVLEEIASENEGKIKIGKVNVDDEPVLADLFKVNSIPLLVYFKDGKPVKSLIGYRPKEDIEELIK